MLTELLITEIQYDIPDVCYIREIGPVADLPVILWGTSVTIEISVTVETRGDS